MNHSKTIPILIVGAGKAGELLSQNLNKDGDMPFDVVGFIDDDTQKKGTKIDNIPVLGNTTELPQITKKHGIQEIFIAIPSERGKTIRKIIEHTEGLGLVYKILPRLSEVLIQDFDKDYLKYIRRVKPEDLLGGEISKSDQEQITGYVKGKTILITGAAGSIGSELSRQIAARQADKVVFYDWWENGMFDLRNQLIETYPAADFEFIIGDIKDRKKLDQVLRIHKPEIVFHAAAYKHVPLMESNPAEAIKNNIFGTKTVAELAAKHKVAKFILISTDKAVNPTNIMGATKRAAEKMVHILAESQSNTVFCAVRFGNVVNSNGSAIPIFEKQIEKGGPVTVTHPDVTRFFMTIPEAVHLVLQASVIGENNDLFVLDMGESVKIYDLAKLLIMLHGYVPNEDIMIKIVGLRPGEKLYEELLVKEEEITSTTVKKIFRTKNYMSFDSIKFIYNFNLLIESLSDEVLSVDDIRDKLKTMVSTYVPNRNI
jgi:FlaA1/EpsC-like NDP-sugar epimerase